MRTIKFRAYHTVNKVMLENKDLPVLAKNIKDDTVWKYMQFTGLTDKNGNEIYEGDIVSYTRECKKVATVVYSDESCCFMFGLDEIGDNIFDIEIIGNIYQNPDLIPP